MPQAPAKEIAVASPTNDSGNAPKRRRAWYREVLGVILVAVLLAVLIKTFVVQAFYIPSPSMHPTLIENDRVLVDRISYRFHPPRRGDVIVFQAPHPGPSHDNAVAAFLHWFGQGLRLSQGGRDTDFVKRVIGLPGDTVEMNRGQVYVNGTALDEPYLSPTRDLAAYGPYVVPAGDLFVLGDNRTNSDDSRGSLGFIPIDRVIGRAFVRIWPPSRMGWLHGASYGRIATPAERLG
jgi:signal peptidase I